MFEVFQKNAYVFVGFVRLDKNHSTPKVASVELFVRSFGMKFLKMFRYLELLREICFSEIQTTFESYKIARKRRQI